MHSETQTNEKNPPILMSLKHKVAIDCNMQHENFFVEHVCAFIVYDLKVKSLWKEEEEERWTVNGRWKAIQTDQKKRWKYEERKKNNNERSFNPRMDVIERTSARCE